MSAFPYEAMWERQDALERLDLRIRWGQYEIRVLRFHLTSFPPGKVLNFHKHAEFEFHFIPSGAGKVILVDHPFELSEGMLYVTGPGVMHYQEAHTAASMEELCLHIDIVDRGAGSGAVDRWEIAEAEDCVKKLQTLPPKPVMDIYHAMPCFLEAYRACCDNYSGSYTTIKQCVVQILLRTARAYDDGTPRPELPGRDVGASRYRFAMQYIRSNYASPLTLEDVAEKLNISSRQLQRILRAYHQEGSFRGIVEDIRLEAVCRRLDESDLPVEKIATLEGFANGNYLHAVFRKRFGMTPSQYRGRLSKPNPSLPL
ncbi:AraC-type DNA-binding protein [Paenibacillus sp. UNCCL117]|uniref:AraC family transcriptional regulator n=1 Tax=unclassified Paenibacillus TaxID=185978 RepID=UPI00088B39DF|nr:MULTISPECIES: AraC family transcriptional regulator [unclassified Paenibacillus]SDC65965.1 AraC-type DNA-binding protein [Paenibacillus sp. cl123]SFW22916.1 AraC-type DNA-binding protein [Paenibacillus sp. UNCCL117]